MHHDTLHGTEHPHGTHDVPLTVLNTPTVVMIFHHMHHDIPHGTHDNPHGTHDIPYMYHDIPYGTEHLMVVMISPTVLNTPTVLMISPTCIVISPTVLNIPTVLKISPTVLKVTPTLLNTPTVLNISPHGTEDNLTSTVLNSTEHSHGTHDIPTFIMISPIVLNTPTVLHTHYTRCEQLKQQSVA